ncbi:MAG TPA: acyltransferase [Lachnospiraceae bacterium]|nr:acyltransferase [Lachnospiraceae bacterium]
MSVGTLIRQMALGYKSSSESYIRFLRKRGVKVGEGVCLFRPFQTTIDCQNPHLLTIGNYVQMTGPVTILTHDYSWSVLKRKYGEICGKQLKTVIGDNVFLGWGALVLPGTTIGNNVIVGAHSICSGRLESNSVYGGSPARYIMSLDEFYAKRSARQLDEAVQYVLSYKSGLGGVPPMEKLDEYFFLFWNREYEGFEPFEKKLRLVGNYEDSKEALRKKHKPFASYEEFLKYCEEQYGS